MIATRRLWIGTSWKMTKIISEALDYVDAVAAAEVPAGIQPFLLPSHTALAAARDRLPARSPILLGAQNAHWGSEGAVTGEVSMRMVADAGARLVEVGHSERRLGFGDSDDVVALKAGAAVAAGLLPLICVGEQAAVRDVGGAADFVAEQVRSSLRRVPRDSRVLIAYEPVWAIGEHGQAATPAEIAPVLVAIREAMVRGGVRGSVLYGGSVRPELVPGLLDELALDGLFVGRAAWTAAGFLDLLRAAAPYAEQVAADHPIELEDCRHG